MTFGGFNRIFDILSIDRFVKEFCLKADPGPIDENWFRFNARLVLKSEYAGVADPELATEQ